MSKSYFLVKLRKFESAPTVMYCILSSFIQENTQELSVTIYTHYSLAIWLRSFTKWVLQNKEERRNSVNREAACMNSRGSFSGLHLLLQTSSTQHDVAQHLKTRYQQYAVYHSEKLTTILQARLDKFPLFQIKKKDDNQKIK